MTQRRLILSSALVAAFAVGCGSDTKDPVSGGGGPDSGFITLADGAIVPVNPDGGTPSGLPEGGAIIVPPSTEKYIEDHSGDTQVPSATIDTLKAAAMAAGAGSVAGNGGVNPQPSNCTDMVYPYEGTVMPAGLISPPMMFNTGYDAVYVRAGYVNSDRLDYQYAEPAKNPGELRIPAEQWANIVSRTQGTPLTLTFAFSRGGATSTCVARMSIASGVMTGALYYNTYNDTQSNGVGSVLRLTLGQTQPVGYLRELLGVPPIGPCIGCHSVSADGSTLAASKHIYFPASFSAKSYTVGPNPQPAERADVKDAAFGAITPDGDAIFRMGNPSCTAGANAFPRAKNNFPLALGPTKAGLIDTNTGNDIPVSGLLLDDHYYWMPQFAPDGKKLVFNNAHSAGDGVERRELAVADYDPATKTFGAPRVIVTAAQLASLGAVSPNHDYKPAAITIAQAGGLFGGVGGNDGCSSDWGADGDHVAAIPGASCDGPCYPAWPFFTPDGKGIIFSLVSEPDFTLAFPGREKASKSELWYADVATGALVRMANANKVPGGDNEINYYPTVLPVQVGGYYWVFWTSTRPFGHHDLSAPPDAIVGDAIFGSSSSSAAYRKRIWVSAIQPPQAGEFAGGTLTDPSLPPFYLEGQSNTGNTRAFAALNPCQDRGTDCKSGLDCCTGYCNYDDKTMKGTCGDKITCAKLNEKCEVDTDCCAPTSDKDTPLSCIGGFCGFLLLR